MKSWLQLAGLVALGVAVTIAAGLALSFLHDPFGLTARKLAAARAGQADAQAQAVIAQAGAGAAHDAADVVAAGVDRTTAVNSIHEANRDDIIRAPGADLQLDPDYLRRLDLGLCRYAAYAGDPGCPGLRAADSAQLPDAGGGDAAAGA